MTQGFGRGAWLVAAVVCTSLLVSCGQRKTTIAIPNCPAAGLVAHMSTLTRFAGEDKTADNVIFDATMTDLDANCEETGGGVRTTVSFSIVARKGPALTDPTQQMTYYVTILRDNYLITNKQKFTTQIRFSPNDDTAGVRETFVQRFEDAETPKRYHYEILVGFELSPRELHFNVVR